MNNDTKFGILGFSLGIVGFILLILLQLVFLAIAIICGFQAYDAFFVSDAIAAGIAWSIYPALYIIGLLNRG